MKRTIPKASCPKASCPKLGECTRPRNHIREGVRVGARNRIPQDLLYYHKVQGTGPPFQVESPAKDVLLPG